MRKVSKVITTVLRFAFLQKLIAVSYTVFTWLCTFIQSLLPVPSLQSSVDGTGSQRLMPKSQQELMERRAQAQNWEGGSGP